MHDGSLFLASNLYSACLCGFENAAINQCLLAMGSPLGPLMANVFLCHLEDKLTRDGVMPTFYKRYVDDTLARMPSTDAAVDFLTTLNSLHPSLSFTMELPVDNKISFIGIEIIKNRTKIDTQVYNKPTNTGLLLHFQICTLFFGRGGGGGEFVPVFLQKSTHYTKHPYWGPNR